MDVGCPQVLVSEGGTIIFNDFTGTPYDLPEGNGYLMQYVEGNDHAPIRNPVTNLPRKSGGYVHMFWKGPKPIILQGLVIGTTPEHRQTLNDFLLGVTDACLASDGTYSWTPEGGGIRSHAVRLFDSEEILGASGGPGTSPGNVAAPKQYAFSLIAADPEPT